MKLKEWLSNVYLYEVQEKQELSPIRKIEGIWYSEGLNWDK